MQSLRALITAYHIPIITILIIIATSERAGSILISDMGEKIVFSTFFRWNVYSTPFAGSFYPYMELVTIYGVPHGKFCLRSSWNRAVSCILCILCSVLWLLKRKSRHLNFQVTDSFLNFKHLQYIYIYICSCTKLFAYHCLASVVLKTCIAQFDLIVVY
jgi:uncharacterized membrane protein